MSEWPGATGSTPMASAAAPAQVLSYSSIRVSRPGILTAVGVISIILASLGILFGVASVFSAAFWAVMAGTNFAGVPVAQAAPAGTAGQTLSAEDADAIVAALDAVQPIAPADQPRLSAALLTSNIPLDPPAEGAGWTEAHIAPQVTGSTTRSGGFQTFTTSEGNINIAPGEITISNMTGGFSTTVVDARGVATTTSMSGTPFGGMSITVTVIQLVMGLLNLGLAVLLMVAGIQILRDSPTAPKLHRWWAWPKLAVVATGTGVGIWAALDMMDGFGFTTSTTQLSAGAGAATSTTNNFGTALGWMIVVPSVVMGLIACIYPVAVLLVFRSETARRYQAELRARYSPLDPAAATAATAHEAQPA